MERRGIRGNGHSGTTERLDGCLLINKYVCGDGVGSSARGTRGWGWVTCGGQGVDLVKWLMVMDGGGAWYLIWENDDFESIESQSLSA